MNTLLLSFFILTQSLSIQKDSIRLSGRASYYAKKFSGRRTSNGEQYNPDKYTCAHRKLPFGTVLKVLNPENGKSVWVKVNDRGPYRKKRIIDLSLIAAKKLDIVQKGHAFVTLELPQHRDSLNLMDSVMLQYPKPKPAVSKKRGKLVRATAHKVLKTKHKKSHK